MKENIPFTIIIALMLASCGAADNKTDSSVTPIDKNKDSLTAITDSLTLLPAQTNQEEKNITVDSATVLPVPKLSIRKTKNNAGSKPRPSTRGVTRGISAEPEDILANIDTYLVSAAQYTTSPSDGIVNCIVTVTNTLTDITFQKTMIEVIIKNQEGVDLKRNFYTLLSIEPGMSKVVKIPSIAKGSKAVTQVVKVKSIELTNGDWVLTGIHYISN
jgi:hypothetical protein